MITTAIFSLTYREAYEYARGKNIPLSDWVYVTDPEVLRGVEITEMIELSGWQSDPKKRRAYEDLLARTMYRHAYNVVPIRPHAER